MDAGCRGASFGAVVPRRDAYRVNYDTEACAPTSSIHRLQRGLPGYLIPVSYTHLDVYKRQNRLSYKPIFPAFRLFPQAFGGDKRDRTADRCV